MHTRRTIDELLDEHGLAPRRDLGQNFVADANTVRRIARLAEVGAGDHVVEIGAGLGPLAGKIWRFSLMGYSARPENVMLCLSALGSVLSDMGYKVHVGEAEAADVRGIAE